MGFSATPRYLGTTFDDAAPGHRFSLYLPLWQRNEWSRERDRQAGKDGSAAAGKMPALASTTRLPAHSIRLMESLLARQRLLAGPLESTGQLLEVQATSVAPFMTGMGIEHPLENGFAFLNPYGLPYLPGSGIKGVLRTAARELTEGLFGNTAEWTAAAIDALFGSDGEADDTARRRGALSFWDVIPQISGSALSIEVMTPHQSHYLQDKATPHESGSPNPITFLTVPPGALFCFHLQCHRPLLAHSAPQLLEDDKWKRLLAAALEHAFEWLGFGAKTAVGYGAMSRLSEEDADALDRESAAAGLRCAWVDGAIERLAGVHRSPPEVVLRGRGLAEEWSKLEAGDLKLAALEDIRARWQQQGWWDLPPGKASKAARQIYEGAD